MKKFKKTASVRRAAQLFIKFAEDLNQASRIPYGSTSQKAYNMSSLAGYSEADRQRLNDFRSSNMPIQSNEYYSRPSNIRESAAINPTFYPEFSVGNQAALSGEMESLRRQKALQRYMNKVNNRRPMNLEHYKNIPAITDLPPRGLGERMR